MTIPSSPTPSSSDINNNNPTHLRLTNDPAQVAAYLKRCRNEMSKANTEPNTEPDTGPTNTNPPHGATDSPAYSFIDFAQDMGMTDFEDPYQIRALLESQAQMLGTVFQYVILEGDWTHLPSALRSQKVMRETLDLMQTYPLLSYNYSMPSPPSTESSHHVSTMD